MSYLEVKDDVNYLKVRVQHAPKEMFLREAIMNCIEAIGSKEGNICITSVDPSFIEEVTIKSQEEYNQNPNRKKLCIANDCPNGALSAYELRAATDIASSIKKVQGIHDNFGQGIKLTALAANEFGFIWISRVNGEKHAVWLRLDKTTDAYLRVDFFDTMMDASEWGSHDLDIINLTNCTIPELDSRFKGDYNAYIFLGNEPKQDTTSDPFGKGDLPSGWIPNRIYQRFAYIPENVSIYTSIHSQGQGQGRSGFRKFIPKLKVFELENVVAKGVIKETKKLPCGHKIHYMFDPQYGGFHHLASKIGNLATSRSFSGFIYKDEIYDVTESGQSWKMVARQMGIPYGSKNLTVFVEIPKGNWKPDSDRQYIRHNDTENTPIKLVDFRDIVKDNRPEWFIKKIEEAMPVNFGVDAQEILENILKHYEKVKGSEDGGDEDKAVKRRVNPNLQKEETEKTDDEFSLVPDEPVAPKPQKKPESGLDPNNPSGRRKGLLSPKVVEIRTQEELDNPEYSEELKEKVAEYDYVNQIITMNYLYINDIKTGFVKEFSTDDGYDDEIENAIAHYIETKTVEAVGSVVINAQHKLFKSGWNNEDRLKATSMAALTNQADIVLRSPTLEGELEKVASKALKDAKSMGKKKAS